MTNETETSFRVIAFKGGGFVLVDTSSEGDPIVLRAVSSLDELTGALSRAVIEWHAETQRVQAAHLADENPKVVAPRKWWRAIT